MNDAIITKPNPIKILSISRAPLSELLNFLIYSAHPELLSESARRQPPVRFVKMPSTVGELKDILRAEKCDKNKKLYFDCEKGENTVAVLLHNQGTQFWIHYFRCGIGLVNLSFFGHLAGAEASVVNKTRSITHGNEFQWFKHDLRPEIFSGEITDARIMELGDYFVERVNSTLVSPYSIYYENSPIKEPYRFVAGSLERLKEILTWTRFVCEGLKRAREQNGKTYVSPHMTINCGNLKDAPTFERVSETFVNSVGALAVRVNAPYTLLRREGYGRRAGGECYDWARKNKHRIYLNLEQEKKDVTAREKLAARALLVGWLRKQNGDGERIINTWKLEN